MSLTIPFTFIGGPGNKAKASEVNANFTAVAAKFTTGTGGIDASDIKNGAGIRGGGTSRQLSTTTGERVDTAAIEEEAVTDAKLANDTASPGLDVGRAVSGDHVKAVTAAQLDRILPNTPAAGVTGRKLKYVVATIALSGTVSDGFLLEFAFTPSLSSLVVVPLGIWLQHATDVTNSRQVLIDLIEEGTTLKARVTCPAPTFQTLDLTGYTAKLAYVSIS